jgi:hypothetical protein
MSFLVDINNWGEAILRVTVFTGKIQTEEGGAPSTGEEEEEKHRL